MALALPVAAQDDAVPEEPPPPPTETKAAPTKKGIEDPPLHRWGALTLSVAAWDPSLVGADEEIATTYQNGIGFPLMQGSTPRTRETVAAIYHLPHDVGSIVARYDSMSQDDLLQNFTPGQFNFAETRAYPFVLGVFDDGFSDGVSASALRKTREFRLEFSQTAFDSKRARGFWGFGYRQLSHSRTLGITYLAIVPNLPPVIPPVVPENSDPNRLAPPPDSVSQTSLFSGHGVGVSFDLEFPLHPRVSVISGLAIGLIRGSASSDYASRSSYYFRGSVPGVPLTSGELFTILSSGSATEIADVDQKIVAVGVSQSPTSQFAQSYDVYLGLEVKVYRGLKVFSTVRDVYYANVGEYVVPKPGPVNVRTSLSAGYEGYVVGLSWRF